MGHFQPIAVVHIDLVSSVEATSEATSEAQPKHPGSRCHYPKCLQELLRQTNRKGASVKTILIISCVLGLGLTVGPDLAEACLTTHCKNVDSDGVRKTSPGSACTVFVDDRRHHAGDNSIGGFCNYDRDEPVIVTCPLIRERWDRTDGLDCATAYLTRFEPPDNKPDEVCLIETKHWECVLQSKDATGLAGWWEGWSSMASAGMPKFDTKPGYNQSYWQAVLPHSHQVTDSWSRMGSYFLSCELPPVGECGGSNCLTSYKWVESVKASYE